MTTDTKRPKIELGPGGIYYYTDPKTGKTHTSPSYNGLVRGLEDAAAARDRQARKEREYAQRIADRKADGAARLADLAPRLDTAQTERDDAHARFRREALAGGAFLDAYARYLLAFRRHASLKIDHNDARHESLHGEDRRGAPVEPRPPTLPEALQTLVTERAAELKTATADG